MEPRYHSDAGRIDDGSQGQHTAVTIEREPEQRTPDKNDHSFTIDAAPESRFAFSGNAIGASGFYEVREAELADLVAHRIKLGAFTLHRTREELDQEIAVKAAAYETEAALTEQLQIEAWRLEQPGMTEDELTLRLAEYRLQMERVHELHTVEAFRRIRRFGALSAWNDKATEWYAGLTQRSRVAVALGMTAVSSAASGVAALSTDALGPTAAMVSGGLLAGARLYKTYSQVRSGLYRDLQDSIQEEWSPEEVSDTSKSAMGRAALAASESSSGFWSGMKRRLVNRKARPGGAASIEEAAVDGEIQRDAEAVHTEAMSRMERRRRERIERADKVNKRTRIAIIGAGVLAVFGIGSRFIDFGKITDFFDGNPPVGGSTDSPSPTPTPSASVSESPVGEPEPSPSPPSASPEAPPRPPVSPPPPTVPAYSAEALTVEDGEGWYQTFSEVNITDATDQANLLSRVGPELVARDWAYLTPEGSYGISRPGMLPQEVLDLITSSRH